jgi:DNA polymerase I-like protein with 3'-5' exonuclease and polymerase domains
MANYIITRNQSFFQNIGQYNYCNLSDMQLTDIIAVDTETTSLSAFDGEIFAIQIGTGKNNYLIDLQDHKENKIFLQEVMPYIMDKTMIFHNSAFDLSFFFVRNYFPKKVGDTMLASMILHNGEFGVSHSFKNCMERELGIFYDKTEQANIARVQLSQPSTIEYCFNDVDRLLDLHSDLVKKLSEYEAIQSYRLHCKHIRALTYMELCGLPISKDKWKAKMDKDFFQYKECEREIINYIFDNLPKYRVLQMDMFTNEKKVTCMLSSPKQMLEVFKSFGINVSYKEKGVIKESLEKSVISKSNHEFVKIWLKFKEFEHNVTTFGEGIYSKIRYGRIYTHFKPIVDTARISSRKGEINFLNFPSNKETRDCFTANEGFDIIVADYAGQETVVGADITGDEAMIASIVDGKDLHCAFARVLYPELLDLSDEEIIKEHKSKRNASKAPRFCFQFGGTGFTLAENEGMSIEEGNRIEKLFKELHYGVYSYGDKKLKEALDLGYIQYAMGFKLKLPMFDIYKTLDDKINSLGQEFWSKYRAGKAEHKKEEKALAKGNSYIIENQEAYNIFNANKLMMKDYFSLKSQYMRLCLNAPTQGTAAHQTKMATILLFREIERNNDYWNVRIANVIHDEIVMETKHHLSEKYARILEKCMIVGGNMFLTNPILFMSADANIGKSWAEAK